MTLILKLDLDMVNMHLYTKNEIPSYSGSKVVARTDRHTDKHTDPTEIITYPHTRVVIKASMSVDYPLFITSQTGKKSVSKYLETWWSRHRIPFN